MLLRHLLQRLNERGVVVLEQVPPRRLPADVRDHDVLVRQARRLRSRPRFPRVPLLLVILQSRERLELVPARDDRVRLHANVERALVDAREAQHPAAHGLPPQLCEVPSLAHVLRGLARDALVLRAAQRALERGRAVREQHRVEVPRAPRRERVRRRDHAVVPVVLHLDVQRGEHRAEHVRVKPGSVAPALGERMCEDQAVDGRRVADCGGLGVHDRVEGALPERPRAEEPLSDEVVVVVEELRGLVDDESVAGHRP